MNVEPTCRFCMRKMKPMVPFHSRGRTMYSYYCQPCRSEQLYDEDAVPYEYSFRVGEYICKFNQPNIKFEIVRETARAGGDAGLVNRTQVLKMDFVPINLRPDNTTVERIKTLILFS